MTGQVRAFLAVLGADLRREVRTGEALFPMLMFSLVVLLVAGFAFDLPALPAEERRRLAPGILWIAIAFATLVGQARSLLADREDDRWTGLLLSPLDRTLLFLAKWTVGLGLAAALELVLVPLTVILFELPAGVSWGGFAAILALCSGGLAALGTLVGAIVARLGRGEALLAILVLPAAAPVLIAGVRSTGVLLGGGTLLDAAPWPAVAAGTLVLYLALGGLLFESALQE